MIASLRDSDELQLNAYCDGELDPASVIEFERRMVNDEFPDGKIQPAGIITAVGSFASAG